MIKAICRINGRDNRVQKTLEKLAEKGPSIEPRASWESLIAVIVLAGLAVVMFFTSPTDGDFSWSDAPRHAMNGIFLGDFLREMPIGDPKGWAMNYYIQYPAITVLFYPPLFSVVLAGAYQLFGFSHEVAQGTVAVFHFLLAFGVFALSRRWMPFAYALSASFLLAAAPEIAYWGRQVMLDIPAFAWLTLMAGAFIRYLDGQNPRDWYLTLFFYLLALYTKQNPLFVSGALFLGLLVARGTSLFRDRHIWTGAILFAVALIPLVVIHFKFGQINTASMIGSERPDVSRLSLEAWTYYITILPKQLGWPTIVMSLVFVLGAVISSRWRIPKAHMVFLVSWFVLGYLMFSFIMVRIPRHDLMALLPLPIFAALGVWRLSQSMSTVPSAFGQAFALTLGIGVLGWSAYFYPVKYVRGYHEAADFVAERAPENGVVMFHGYRDGNFTFNIRAGDRSDVSVARSDKLLIRVAIERIRGVEDRGFAEEQIEQIFQRFGIRHVVAQPGFWDDLPSFRALEGVLADENKFRIVKTIQTEANFTPADKTLVIYEYLGEIQSPPEPMSVEMVGIGQTFEKT